MEEDIKVLENFINKQKSNKGTFVPTDFEITAIENLIKKNKELETQIGLFKNTNKNAVAIFNETYRNHYISKDKIKEKIKELKYKEEICLKEDMLLKSEIHSNINMLQELLEERN